MWRPWICLVRLLRVFVPEERWQNTWGDSSQSKKCHPKDHWTLKTGFFEDPTPAIQVQTLPLEGPRFLGQYFCNILLDTVLDLLFTESECICIGACYVISPCCQSKHKLIGLFFLNEKQMRSNPSSIVEHNLELRFLRAILDPSTNDQIDVSLPHKIGQVMSGVEIGVYIFVVVKESYILGVCFFK